MRYFLSTLALTALASSCACVSALETNCDGSKWCQFKGDNTTALVLQTEIKTRVNETRRYMNDQKIVCVGEICAFLRGIGPDGVTGDEVKTLAQNIYEHECKTCGSTPVGNDNRDDVNTKGELAFDYVERSTLSDVECSIRVKRCYYG